MEGKRSHLEVEMLLDEATFTAMRGQGLDPILAMWPEACKGIPFKYATTDLSIAKKYYDKAQQAGYVIGPPTHLVQIRMRSEWALAHFIRKELIADPYYEGVYFKKTINATNYTGANWGERGYMTISEWNDE